MIDLTAVMTVAMKSFTPNFNVFSDLPLFSCKPRSETYEWRECNHTLTISHKCRAEPVLYLLVRSNSGLLLCSVVTCLCTPWGIHGLGARQLMLRPMFQLTRIVAVTRVPTAVEYCFFPTVCTLTDTSQYDTDFIDNNEIFPTDCAGLC